MKHRYLAFSVVFLMSAAASDAQTTSVTLNSSPSRQIGQPLLIPKTSHPNLVEGRELWNPTGIALDTSASPPIVYVADTSNNRVLAWKNATGFTNGQTADLAIGQPDLFTTTPSGPGTTFTTGLSSPTGLAVYNGDLYVADSGNNRILRYKAPFTQYAQTGSYPTADLYIGQPSLKSNTANYPSGTPTAQNLNFGSSSGSLIVGLAFDSPAGNLWVTDSGNRRVLEFKASDIANATVRPSAIVELGQLDFTSLQSPLGAGGFNSEIVGNQFAVPCQLAFDAAGNLYVSDADPNNPRGGAGGLSRVLVFAAPFRNDQTAARIMGVVQPSQIQTLTVTQQQAIEAATDFNNPGGIFFLADSSVGVVDTGYNRILIFPPYSSWPAQSTSYSPQATAVLGQNGSFLNVGYNGNTIPTVVTPPANGGVFTAPVSAAFLTSTSELLVADTGNHRVITMPQQSGAVPFGNATRVLGQDTLAMNSPNLIEGREFQFDNGSNADAGIALDESGAVPHLFVADPLNHRVLGFYDARKLQATGIPPGQHADIVIGEPDFNTALCNYPTGDSTQATASSLCHPTDVLTDSSGNLYVADNANGRVLRFPAPFANWPNTQILEPADLVLGQSSLTGAPITDPSASTMAGPYGLAFTGANGLMISDIVDNRVLYIPYASGETTFRAGTDNGKAATTVFGQPDFVTIASGAGINQLYAPHHIAADANGQVYVADTGNGRVQIFSDPNNPLTTKADADAILTLPNLANPEAISINQNNGEIWVSSNSGGVASATRYPKYDTLQLNPAPTGSVNVGGVALALLEDQYSDLFVADGFNRVAVYYQGLQGGNAQSTYKFQPLAPGVIATIYSAEASPQFSTPSMPKGGAALTGYPMPATLADVEVLFNGSPAPLYYAGTNQINLVIPMSAPTTGSSDIEVVQVSTGQVLGASSFPMDAVSPAIFCGVAGDVCPLIPGAFYQAAVINQDGTLNSTTNAAPRGSIISIYCTGQGALINPPADGAAPGTSPLSTTPQTPRVAMGSNFVDNMPLMAGDPTNGQWVSYSGLAPGFAGLWQINVQIPMAVPPAAQVPIGIQYDGVGSANLSSVYHLTIAVK